MQDKKSTCQQENNKTHMWHLWLNVFQVLYGVTLVFVGVYRCHCLCLQMSCNAMQNKKNVSTQHNNVKCRSFCGASGVGTCSTLIHTHIKNSLWDFYLSCRRNISVILVLAVPDALCCPVISSQYRNLVL